MTPWVIRLITVNVVVFFATASSPRLFQSMALVPLAVVARPWTVVTYMFLHAGFAHLLFNMIGLFFFGPRLEVRLGSADFLKLYFLSGLGGALFSLMFAPYAAVVGASGAVFGILLGFALYYPRENIYIWGVLPVQARWLAAFLVAVSLYSGMSGSGSGVAHFAHLGGLAAGFLYLRLRDRPKKRRIVEAPNSFYSSQGVRDQESRSRWESIPLEELHELNRGEVEMLLEKLRALGVRGLTQGEREFLDRMVPRSRQSR